MNVCLFSRLQRLWEEEVAKVGVEKASLFRVVLRFQRTRLILSVLVGILAMVAVFLGPVSHHLKAPVLPLVAAVIQISYSLSVILN